MKKINSVWYNVDLIKKMSLEEFKAISNGCTDAKVENIYYEITGRKELKAPKKTKVPKPFNTK